MLNRIYTIKYMRKNDKAFTVHVGQAVVKQTINAFKALNLRIISVN